MIPDVVGYHGGILKVLDQTALPHEVREVELDSLAAVERAIRDLVVRGAPLIGVTAAYGVCVALSDQPSLKAARAAAPEILKRLRATRPTAVNLFWALERMETALARLPVAEWPEGEWAKALAAEARAIDEDNAGRDRKMAAHGITLLESGARVVTHCNTGALATGGLGTALGVVIEGHRSLGGLHVFVDETRPRWQGAHLTTWELDRSGVPHTLIVDNAAAALMAQGGVHSVWVGADRIAANGDTANKIGTYSLALAARHHGVPFYVVAPGSTIDPSLPGGGGIPIEERDGAEVLNPGGRDIAPAGTVVWNPAFDVTPAALITAIVTEAGVFRGPEYSFGSDDLPAGHGQLSTGAKQ